ncbi:hydrophobin 2 [Dentipellis sp. KUC8613]|nr:hydrophobin 2 [Dentipellis sp. KUC8613]
MLARVSAVFVSVLATSAVMVAASPAPWGNPTTTPPVTVTVTAPATTSTVPASQCNTGPVQCCNSVQKASSPAAAGLLGLLGIVIQDVTALVGLGCTPISVVGVGSGATCQAQPVCCENNNFNGLINIGCSPVNINL